MSLTTSEMTPADIAAVTNNNGGWGGFGGDGAWWIILLFLFGWGRNGNWGGGGGCGAQSSCATTADVYGAVDQQTLISKLDQQTYGLADATYALNNTMTNGFHGVDNAICNLGYNVQSGFNALGHQISDCCCTTQRAIDGVNYNMAKGFCDLGNVINMQTRDVIDNQNNNTRAILDFLVNDKMSTLTAENQALKSQAYLSATIDASRAELIRRLGADCPSPAYVVQPPQPVTFPTNCCGQAQFGGSVCGGF